MPTFERAAEPPHDILAAEEFGVPAADPELRPRRVVLPGDPTGIEEPHDVLAAEEFPMPAPRHRPVTGLGTASARHRGIATALVGVALMAAVLRRRRG